MTTFSKADAITRAERLLRSSFPVPWHDFDQAAQDVLQNYPTAHGETLVNLIMEAALKQWASGVTCCDG